jgi:hypothetical protein
LVVEPTPDPFARGAVHEKTLMAHTGR